MQPAVYSANAVSLLPEKRVCMEPQLNLGRLDWAVGTRHGKCDRYRAHFIILKREATFCPKHFGLLRRISTCFNVEFEPNDSLTPHPTVALEAPDMALG